MANVPCDRPLVACKRIRSHDSLALNSHVRSGRWHQRTRLVHRPSLSAGAVPGRTPDVRRSMVRHIGPIDGRVGRARGLPITQRRQRLLGRLRSSSHARTGIALLSRRDHGSGADLVASAGDDSQPNRRTTGTRNTTSWRHGATTARHRNEKLGALVGSGGVHRGSVVRRPGTTFTNRHPSNGH